ncbi:aspartate--tRNA(Asn) ligase [Candidatus Roizmanbacteria bacterium RIFOXYB2_FULL_38_10]|uniref:Aspartate--tRNA ligase n=1 Tax=Candidatus Roizmanbacteria bacterium RIFOXYD1_FULL_38_12 TaxID=1802093 RepID=A0A1F7KZQ2_9BACT|nr:MAG: aspartate--tRNA(Asn) ligase [Candidatus Roizmanbacteria bacterium RIFOXYA2_FULL_38_14]OGK63335.1 MAG: aspartate--tRNA(Asn) ligase [Candidatus Roizmanbacteria bacterium RIFOXYA1_FULL_37_12]OGK65181.1 MAG: aspartate--tRNA(Asn) ligase [Candidatus Roizmanbacteria bacterium RIFOXYB1_FULL_40_23]OGK68736.1 MAG: aspartate--tRNA(Asn) ligase [Candidatus Roizmanbacteria bacterium RIFOXYB2_FULL_38_10]OGK69586.1 MAG: aspartate--tRNA(Asn) ligase [Candidatus Roizmanbacteria bacterium RIFOXYC1_FULL_38_
MKTLYIVDTLNQIGQEVELKGWINTKRDHKKIVFLDLRDKTGIVQVVGGEEFKTLSPEAVVSIRGIVKKRPDKLINPKILTGKIEIEAREFKLLSKAEELPFDIAKENLDVTLPILLDYRPLTLRHPKIQAIFRVQETIVQTFRSTMKNLGFTEFQAPTMVATATEGGAEVFPIQYFEHKAYLAQSPQFYKQIMVSIFEKVFTVAHAYRAEPSVTTRHLTEYVGLDAEMGFIDSWTEIMDTAELLVKEIFKAVKEKHQDILSLYDIDTPQVSDHIPRVKLKEAQQIIFDRTKRDIRQEPDLDPEGEREMWRWAKENHQSELVFITHYPTKKRPMYTHPDPESPEETLSFDMIGRGQEWITGGQRIHDYKKLVENIKKWKCDPKAFETPYLQAFKFGMPPEGGFCLGLERITMNILGLSNIREATLFPRDMERIDIRLSKEEQNTPPVSQTNISVFERIQAMLKQNGVEFKHLMHKPVYTSLEASKVRGTTLQQGAKALLMYADGKPLMLVLPAHRKVDTKRFKTTQHIKDLRMATPQEVKKLIGVEIGAVPPFGNLFTLPLFVDKGLGVNKRIVFNAGDHAQSIEMEYQDYVRISAPTLDDFSV